MRRGRLRDAIRIAVTVDDKDTPSLREISDGLSGEMPSEHGWIARFSTEK
jgi:hypothetical protein